MHASMDMIFCDTSVNFNVPGQRKAPSTELLATVWKLRRFIPTGTIEKYAIEFTDVGGSLGSTAVPLNTWVQIDDLSEAESLIEEEATSPATSPLIGDAFVSMCVI